MSEKKPIRKAVFPVAGMGTRFLPATKSIPKEMLPLVDRPLIQYAIDEAREAGIEERDILSSTRDQARALLWVYAAISVLAVLALWPLMPSFWEALMIALSAVSTGGFSPRPDSLASYPVAAQVVTMVACLATSVSLLFYVYARRYGLGPAWEKTNTGAGKLAIFNGVVQLPESRIVGAHQNRPLERDLAHFLAPVLGHGRRGEKSGNRRRCE